MAMRNDRFSGVRGSRGTLFHHWTVFRTPLAYPYIGETVEVRYDTTDSTGEVVSTDEATLDDAKSQAGWQLAPAEVRAFFDGLPVRAV